MRTTKKPAKAPAMRRRSPARKPRRTPSREPSGVGARIGALVVAELASMGALALTSTVMSEEAATRVAAGVRLAAAGAGAKFGNDAELALTDPRTHRAALKMARDTGVSIQNAYVAVINKVTG